MKRRNHFLVIWVSHTLTIELRWITGIAEWACDGTTWLQASIIFHSAPRCHTGGGRGFDWTAKETLHIQTFRVLIEHNGKKIDERCSAQKIPISLCSSLHPNQYFRSPWHGAVALSEWISVFSTNLNTSKQTPGPWRDFILSAIMFDKWDSDRRKRGTSNATRAPLHLYWIYVWREIA